MTVFRLIVAAAAAVTLALAALPGSAQDKAAKKGKLATADQQALQRLVQADRAEIAAGKLAARKGESVMVKQYGEHLAKEHQEMLRKAGLLARANGVKPAARPGTAQQAALKKLEKLSGNAFDRAFMAQMVKDHEDALARAQKTASEAKNLDLQAHARVGAGIIERHLEQARQIHASLGGSASAGASRPGKKDKK